MDRTKQRVKMWVRPQFKKAVYKLHAENPDKTLEEITEEISEAIEDNSFFKMREKKKNGFWQ